MTSHGALLRALLRDDNLTDAIFRDPLTAPVHPRMKAIATYTHKLTATPWAVTGGDIEPMRAAGLSESEIADVNYICGYFSMMNRLAQGLGIETERGFPNLPIE